MLLQSPLSADPDLHAGIASRLDEIVALAREELADSLQSVLLGGSLARGEAFGVRDRGALRLLSDLDLYFVTDAPDTGGLVRRVNAWAADDPFLVTRPDIAVVPARFFTEAPEAMPTHQLAHAHLVLWGAPVEIRGARDQAGIPLVDPDDAGALLFNRFVESLDPSLDELSRLMHRTKEFIDAPMAWLGSVGAYTPDRRAQVERLRALGIEWHSACAEHLDGALNHWAACLKARAKGVVEREDLEALASASGTTWFDWTGGFSMALLTGTGIEAVHTAMRDGLDHDRLQEAVQTWLKRRGWVSRLRRARQWQGIAPADVTSWRQHGAGGTGPERIFGAACLRYHGVERWTEPLEGLTHEPVTDPAALYALWWTWIQGRGGHE